MLKKHYLKYARLGKGEIMGRFVKKIKNKQYGQAMAEFALTLPIFLLALLGVIELSRFFLSYSSVFTASREASRFGSSVGDIQNPNFENCGMISQVAQDAGFFGGVSPSDITIYYEKSPGVKAGDCGSYHPDLGDRLVVEVQTTYRPIIGIIPTMPINAVSGRTIMKQIKVYSTPVDIPTCNEAVSFVGSLEIVDDDDDNKIRIYLQNDSTLQHFRIHEIKEIQWTGSDLEPPVPNLTSIELDGNEIWNAQIIPLEEDVDTDGVFSITTWSSVNNRNLPAKENELDPVVPVPLTFIFDNNLVNVDDFELDFFLVVINNALIADKCDPVE